MRRVQLIGSIVIVFVLLASMTGNAFAARPAQWTVMVYMSGDNDLDGYIVSDIEQELAFTGSTPDVQVVALADRGPGFNNSNTDWQTTKLFHVTRNMKADAASAVKDWGERDMANPQTLLEFVNWTKANYPAGRYALVFWGHGWNWHPDYVMRDDTNGKNTMDYEELKPVIPSLGFMDVVAYDGCNMASIEVFDLWHGHATAVSSSQEFVFSEGLQYDLVLPQLDANPGMTADQLAIAFTRNASADKTWSAVAVDGRLDALITAVDQWSLALTSGLAANRSSYSHAFTSTRAFWKAPQDRDLYDMAYEIHRNVTNADIRLRSQAVMNAVASVVLYERHANAYIEAHGVTIYLITKSAEMDKLFAYYSNTLDFAAQTGWNEFLEAYASSGKQ